MNKVSPKKLQKQIPQRTTEPNIQTSHNDSGFYDREVKIKRIADRVIEWEVKHKTHIDAIVMRGISGALIGIPLADYLHKGMLFIRKPGESPHTSRIVEGDYGAKTLMIVDDFICTGETIFKIRQALSEELEDGFTVPLVALYNGWENTPAIEQGARSEAQMAAARLNRVSVSLIYGNNETLEYFLLDA